MWQPKFRGMHETAVSSPQLYEAGTRGMTIVKGFIFLRRVGPE